MARTTRKQLDSMVDLLNKKLNRPTSPFRWENDRIVGGNPGYLFIEEASIKGLYRLTEMMEHGERQPIGAQSHTAGELWQILYAIQQVVLYGEFKKYE